MADKSLGKSKEDYLEAILMLNKRHGWCREIDIAVQLGFSKPSVSIALTKLEKDGYLTRESSGEIRLTDAGMEVASKTLEKHETLTYILEKIGVDADTAEDEACLLEHSISAGTFQKIKAYVDKEMKEKETVKENKAEGAGTAI